MGFLGCSQKGYAPVAVCGLLVTVASLVAEHRLQVARAQQSNCVSLAVPLPVGPSLTRDRTQVPLALAGVFLTTGPPGRPRP